MTNYKISYWIYELFVTHAHLDSAKKVVTLTTSNSQGVGDNSYLLKVLHVQDTNGNALSDSGISADFDGTYPEGLAEVGGPGDYVITGTVEDNHGSALSGILITIWSNGPDGVMGLNWGINDDIQVNVISDEEGRYEIRGIPSPTEPELSSSNLILFWAGNNEQTYEGYRIEFFTSQTPSPYQRKVILYEAVPGTKIEGSIKDNMGNLISGTISIDFSRGDVFVSSIGDHCDDPLVPGCHYDPETGYFYTKDIIAGGVYKIEAMAGSSLYYASASAVDVTPGQTLRHDITVYEKTANQLLPICMTTPVSNSVSSYPITFRWQDTDHQGIQSYVLGIWSESKVDLSGDYPAPQGPPDMLNYLVSEAINEVTIDPTTSPMAISGDIYRVVTNVPLPSEKTYYWGIFAYNATYNEADIAGQFSGEPESGLWPFYYDEKIVGIEEEHLNAVPADFSLSQNYPNPFNPETSIGFGLPERSAVALSIYNINGGLVRTIVHESREAGHYTVCWDGRDTAGKPVASGVYFGGLYVTTQDGKSYDKVTKMVLMK